MKTITSRSWDYGYEHALDEELKALRDAIASGSASDWANYQYLCGQIRGIQVAIDALTRIREKLNRDGDQD